MTLSPTQTQILTTAAQHEHSIAHSPSGLPAGARNAVFRSMLRNGLLAEVAAPRRAARARRPHSAKKRGATRVASSPYAPLDIRIVASSEARPIPSMTSAVVPCTLAKAWAACPTNVSSPQPSSRSASQAQS